MIYLKDELHGGANKMNNDFTLLYDLCERTYISRILEKTIGDINAHLQKLANKTRSAAVIMIADISESDQTNGILVGFHMVFPDTICVNVGIVKNISFTSICDFIRQYYEDQNINVNIDHSNGNLELSWENQIQEYLDANTKADNNDNTSEPYDGGCIDVNKVIEEIESFMQTCCRIKKSKYIHLSITFCDLNFEENIFEGDLNNITYNIKLPNNDRGEAFLGDIYQYFHNNDNYHIEFRPIAKLSESRRYEIRQNDEYKEYIKLQLDTSRTSCSDQVSDTKTTDTVTATGVYTDTKRGNIIISNDKNRIEWDGISNCLNYHLNEQSEEYMYIQIQSGSYETLKHPIRIEDNIWRLPIQLLDIDSPEVMAGYVCDFCTELGYDIRLVFTAYNNVGVTGYMIYMVSKKK